MLAQLCLQSTRSRRPRGALRKFMSGPDAEPFARMFVVTGGPDAAAPL
jgi:hypothetical protein